MAPKKSYYEMQKLNFAQCRHLLCGFPCYRYR